MDIASRGLSFLAHDLAWLGVDDCRFPSLLLPLFGHVAFFFSFTSELARLSFPLTALPYAPHDNSTRLVTSPMDRPAKAKLASLLKKRQRAASSSASSAGPATKNKKAAATASKHSPSSSASPPKKARASSISSPDARAKAVDLLVQALRVVDAEKKKGEGPAAGQGDKKKEGGEATNTKPAAAVAAAAGGVNKKGDLKKDAAAGKEMTPPAAPAASAAGAGTAPFPESRVREVRTIAQVEQREK